MPYYRYDAHLSLNARVAHEKECELLNVGDDVTAESGRIRSVIVADNVRCEIIFYPQVVVGTDSVKCWSGSEIIKVDPSFTLLRAEI